MSEPGPLRDQDLRTSEPLHRPWLGVVLATALFAVLVVGFADLPDATAKLPQIARRAMTGALPDFRDTEPVNAVVYGYRATDTFGETFLLLAAVVSVTLLSRSREPRHGFVGEEEAGAAEQHQADPQAGHTRDEQEARQAEREEEGEGSFATETPDDEPLGTPAPERSEAMTVVTRGGVRSVLPLLLMAGIYLVAAGYSPGGGFPAGAVLLGVVLLVHTGFGYGSVRAFVRPGLLEIVEMVGAVVIIGVLTLGLPLAGSFSANWIPLAPPQNLRSGGTVQAFSVAELVEVGCGLVIAVFALMGMRHDWAPDDHDDGDDDGASP